MKHVFHFSLLAFHLACLSGCQMFGGESDPAEAAAKMAEAREGEKVLVRAIIPDSDRAERFIDLIVARGQLMAAHNERIILYRDRMLALNADYNATREAIDEATSEYNKERIEAGRAYVVLVVAMKKETSASEWKAIIKYQAKHLNPREQVYQGAEGRTQ